MNFSTNNYGFVIRAAYYRLKELFFYRRINECIGNSSYVDPTVHVLRWRNVSIGNFSVVSEGGCVNINNYKREDKHIRIGDYVYIGRRNFISSGDLVEIKSYCMTGSDCALLGADHKIDDPFKPYVSTGVVSKGAIVLGVNVWLGAGVMIVGNVRIGHGSIIGAGSVVLRDIPPFCIAVGNPARVVKFFDFQSNLWVSVNNNCSFTNRPHVPMESDYLEILTKTEIGRMPWRASGRFMGSAW